MRAWFQNLFSPASGAAPSVPLGAESATLPNTTDSPQSEQSMARRFPRPHRGPVGSGSESGDPPPHATAPSESDTDPLQAAFLVTLDDASRFHHVRPLGLGGFGAIYRAEDARSDSRVVIKHYERVHSAASHRIMLEAEIDALRHLKGVPGVPYLYDVLTKRGQPVAIVMEYVDAKPLDPSHLEDTTPEEKRAFLVQLLELLRGCHRRGECHGDIKPGNILVDPQGKAHLIDWGTTRFTPDDDRKETQGTAAPSTFGTPEYISPERILGLELHEKADLYSLGMTLVSMLGRSSTPASFRAPAAAAPGCTEDRDPPRVVLEDLLDPHTAATVQRMISPNADHRPASCDEALAWLELGPTQAATRAPSTQPAETHLHPDAMPEGGQVLIDTGDRLIMYRKVDGALSEVDVIEVPKQWEVAVVDLLMNLFGDHRELRGHFPKQIRSHLPRPSVAFAEGAQQTVEVLLRTGSITPAFFDSLVRECPMRGVEIRAVERRWRAAQGGMG